MINTRNKITLDLIANPFVIAIPVLLIIILLLPNLGSKYKLELKEKHIADKPNSKIYFTDLNGDGLDEKVIVFHNVVRGKSAIKIVDNNSVTYDSWNFNGNYQEHGNNCYFTDLNNDGNKEVFVFYYRNDSAFFFGITAIS